MSDVLATNLMLTRLYSLNLFSIFTLFSGKKERLIIFEVSFINLSPSCVFCYHSKLKSSLRCVENNILSFAWPTSSFNDDTSLCFGFNKVYCALSGLVIEAFRFMKRKRKNLMLSDVEESSNLMLTTLTAVATLHRGQKRIERLAYQFWDGSKLANNNLAKISKSRN